MLIDIPRMLEGFAHRPLRNLVKRHPAKSFVPIFLAFFLFLLLAVAKFFRQMRGNRFAFAVRIRRQINRVHAHSQLLQLGDDFFFTGNDYVLGLEIVINIDTQSALGQIFNVPERGLDRIAFAQILFNCLRLGRRLNDY